MDTPRKIRVAIVDDAPYFRAAIKKALGTLPDFEVVWEAANAKQSIDLTQKSRPDVLLMDYALPGMNGLAACRTIKENQPQVQIVIYSMFADDVKREAASAGACLCIGKDTELSELAEAVIGCTYSGVL